MHFFVSNRECKLSVRRDPAFDFAVLLQMHVANFHIGTILGRHALTDGLYDQGAWQPILQISGLDKVFEGFCLNRPFP
jgi:hypothetical protein